MDGLRQRKMIGAEEDGADGRLEALAALEGLAMFILDWGEG